MTNINCDHDRCGNYYEFTHYINKLTKIAYNYMSSPFCEYTVIT